MVRENIEVGVMFADVAGSTSLYETHGDDAANRIIGRIMTTMAGITAAYQGHVVKTIGDEIMCRFATANDCVRAAIECQEEISAGLQDESLEVQVKIGLHFGSAILMDDGDVFGDAVNIASRMANVAAGAQIITTAESVALLDTGLQVLSRKFDKINVKGKEEPIEVHQIVWEDSDLVTRIGHSASSVDEPTRFLSLTFQGEKIRISSADRHSFVMGRGDQSDLLCQTSLTSRIHATLEFQRGKFFLTDKSSNGTYVKTADGGNIFLRRQELILWGSGSISLGEDVAEQYPDDIIQYVCE